VKDAIHSVFGCELPLINTQAVPSEVQNWKRQTSVKRCFLKLFKKIKADQPTHMEKIINKIWKDRSTASNMQTAFAISICETYLNPENQVIQMNELYMKPKIAKNMVSFKIKTLRRC
jgi:hypothetical protein